MTTRTGATSAGAGPCHEREMSVRAIWKGAVAFGLVVLGPVFGWWLMIIGFAFGSLALTGLVYEYYRGDHAH